MDFFFDNQCRRYLVQFMRIFSDIKVRLGPDANGLYTIQRVPIVYGDPDWMVAQLIKGASENTMLPNPMFSAYIDSIRMAPDRRQDTQYVGKISTIERHFDKTNNQYTSAIGIRQDIERYMPVPYDLYLKLDAWTPNVIIKSQIFEQIAVIFNPSIQLQQNSNLMDWTSIFEVWLEDFTWSNRSIPQGSEDARDIISFKFKVPIWINPPAKIKRSGIIAEIVSNIHNTPVNDPLFDVGSSTYDPFRSLTTGIPSQIITTEGNHRIQVENNGSTDRVILLSKYGINDGTSWQTLIQKYGEITTDITKIRLKLDPNIDVDDKDIIGNIQQDPTDPSSLILTIDQDTLPPTTLPAISDIIDPTEISPGNGLPSASFGQRYLIVSSHGSEELAIPIGSNTSPWGNNLIVYHNDIIEYNGLEWRVIFDSRNSSTQQYVINLSNNTQYMFDPLTKEWTYTYYGQYSPGYWRIDNIIKTNVQ